MYIANPIYDTVFKFLLEDNALAKLLIGAIILPQLHGQHRTEVEAMLQLFDQNRISGDRHRLVIEEAEIPERYRPLLRRLQRAVAEPAIADAMELEDEVLQELQDMERTIERERAEKEKQRERADQERAEKEKERERADQERAEKERLLALLKQAGIDPEA